MRAYHRGSAWLAARRHSTTRPWLLPMPRTNWRPNMGIEAVDCRGLADRANLPCVMPSAINRTTTSPISEADQCASGRDRPPPINRSSWLHVEKPSNTGGESEGPAALRLAHSVSTVQSADAVDHPPSGVRGFPTIPERGVRLRRIRLPCMPDRIASASRSAAGLFG